MSTGPRDLSDAARALEATLLRQLIASSGAFKGNGVAGSHLHAEMFIETLADAVAKGGGLGLARMLEDSLDRGEADLPAPDVTSGFGTRTDPIDGSTRFHTGVDLAGPEGAGIRAAADGVVRSAGKRGGYGNAVEIEHGGGVSTLYAHASSLSVRVGDKVQQGQEVGRVGETGRATGPHLHFEVRVDGRPINPQAALKAYGIRAEDTIGGTPPLRLGDGS